MQNIWGKLFLDHPKSVDESYVEHMGQAFYFSSRLFAGAICCFIHGLVPALFTKTGSDTVLHLNDRMVLNRNRKKAKSALPAPSADGVPEHPFAAER